MILVRRQRRGHLRAAVALAGLAGVLAGCSGGAEEPTVASAASASPSASASVASDPVARYVEAQRAWVRCLRAEGFDDVPDPDAKGRVGLGARGNRERKTD